jgi:ABC-type nitrate/sulfonate/bicarbonate transport system permease component
VRAPEIAETLRMVLGWAWTYVIVAELIGASSGIGHMITDSQALLATDQIIFGIIVIGLIGLRSMVREPTVAWCFKVTPCFRGSASSKTSALA